MDEQSKKFIGQLYKPSVVGTLTIAFGLLYIPAFVYGVVSIWLCIFAGMIALRFRLGIERLNAEIDEVDPPKIRKYHARVALLCLKCMFYMSLPALVFYQIYISGTSDWPTLDGYRFDDMIGLLTLLPSISFSDIANPYERPDLYLISIVSLQAHITLFALFLVAGKSYWRYGVRTMKPLIPKDPPEHLRGWYNYKSFYIRNLYLLFYAILALIIQGIAYQLFNEIYFITFQAGNNSLMFFISIDFGCLLFMYAIFFCILSMMLRFFELGTNFGE